MNTKFRVKAIEMEVGKLSLHPSLNREINVSHVAKRERDLDLDKLGRFAIWREGRTFFVVDGQHRKLALEAVGLGDWKVRCDLYEGGTFDEVCELVLGLNDSLLWNAYDKFDKGVKAGRMANVETKRIVEAAGLKVANQGGDGKLNCPAAAMATWKLDQGPALQRSLFWSTGAWGFTAQAAEGQIVAGLGLLAYRFPNGQIDDAALIKKLSKRSGGAAGLIGAAKTRRESAGGSVARNVALIVHETYNKGRRSGQLAPL